MSEHLHDTTPPALCQILEGFGELFPLSRQAGAVALVINDHAMDEFWLEATQRNLRESLHDLDNTETNTLYWRAELGLVELLLSMPDDMRFGQGRWAAIPPNHALAWAAGGAVKPADEDGVEQEQGETDGADKSPPADLEDIDHPDDQAGAVPGG